MTALVASRARFIWFAGAAPLALIATPALAQVEGAAGVTSEAAQSDTAGPPGDIIVTATKQASAVTRVPVSIAVVTRDAIDQQSLRTAEDIARVTPSLVISNGSGANGSGVTIRGLASQVGAPTVGIYLDDISITRRNANGAFAGNGTNFPQLFDLERVEVLRGPQGTLYGGSSIGGTIKFVLPQPSLSTTTIRVKQEIAFTEQGDPTAELGVSATLPLVADKVGLAISGYGRRNGGYIDHVSRYSGAVLAADTNRQDSLSGRVAVAFAPSEALRITPAIYGSYDRFADQDQYWTNIGGYTQAPFTTPSTAAAPTITGQPYTHPGYVFPDYNVYGPYKTGANCNVGANFATTVRECVQRAPRKQELLLPSLTLDYDFGALALKSITSYTYDRQSGRAPNSYEDLLLYLPQYRGGTFAQDFPSYASEYRYKNVRKGWTQEVRLSADPASWLSFVLGGYYSDFDTRSDYASYSPDFAAFIASQFGQTLPAKFGADTSPYTFYRNQKLDESERALFGELTFKPTDALRVIAGLRVAETRFAYYEAQYGTTTRRAVATIGNGLTVGSIKDNQISPKIAVQYFLPGANMLYASATKGFRPGGVASRPAGTACDAELASLGFGDVTAVPYQSDSVWSYEAGAKVRPFGNALSIDASIYRVDWNDAQVNYRLTCQGSYVANAGRARSQGLDLSTQLRATNWLTLNGTLAYVDAKYDRLAVTINNITTVFINQDDRQPVPKWSFSLGGLVRAPIGGERTGYARLDWQHAGSYPRTFSAGTNGFFPDVYQAEATDFVSARAGFERGGYDVSLFVNNLLNSQDVLSTNLNGGRGGCTYNAADGSFTNCTRNTTYQKQTTFRPRTIGVSLRMRY